MVENPGVRLEALCGGCSLVVADVAQGEARGGGAVARRHVGTLVLVKPLADVVHGYGDRPGRGLRTTG